MIHYNLKRLENYIIKVLLFKKRRVVNMQPFFYFSWVYTDKQLVQLVEICWI